MVDIALQVVCVLYCLNKDEGDDESLPLQAFRRDVVFSEIFKGRQIILKLCKNSIYPIRYLLL